jgi:carboxyl-terminal processing protease
MILIRCWSNIHNNLKYNSKYKFNKKNNDKNNDNINTYINNITKKISKSIAIIGLSMPLFVLPSNAINDNNHVIFDEVWKIVNDNFVDGTYSNHNWEEIKQDFNKKLDDGADEKKIIEKMLSLLNDKYTRLLDKKFFESLWEYDAIGVGLLFLTNPGEIMSVASPPISGSTGEKAGIQKGDLIYAINEKSTEKMQALDVLDMLSNDRSDFLTLEYSRGKNEPHKIVKLLRSTQKANNPVNYESQILNNGKKIGYIKLSEFNSEAVPEVRKAINQLNKENIEAIVLDLRGNTGGGFQFALNIGGMFMDSKVMVIAKGRGTEQTPFMTSYPEGVIYKNQLVLLTDGLSASASEVLSGGLHDNCRAVLAGENTFGKGKIQAVFGLSDGSGITMTVAQYVTPKGTIIQSKGLKPDLPISILNPYLNVVLGPKVLKPDLNLIDFNEAKKKIDSCSIDR